MPAKIHPHGRVLPGLLAATLLASALVGCSSTSMLLEGDVPLPEGMTTVRSADIRRSGGMVTGGRFLLAGGIDDADRLLRSTIARFESSGWRVGAVEHGLDQATATFTKGARTARIQLDRRTLDPDMSAGMLEISSGDSSGDSPRS